MQQIIRIGTRDSQLAVWQATLVQGLLKEAGVASELVYMKSEGDIDTVTPLYALGVTGVFTKTLDAALLNNRIDIAVHSMKDVPTQLAQGIQQAAVLKRASHKDILVFHPDLDQRDSQFEVASIEIMLSGSKTSEDKIVFPLRENPEKPGTPEDVVIATGSVRRIAQWLHRFPEHKMENLRGNVNTRLRKLKESNWHGAIFAAAGLERINLRPDHSIDLDWMLPAPAQGAIMVVCREGDNYAFEACQSFNDEATALCTKIEKDFLRVLMGGCSTPISAYAELKKENVHFRGNVCSPDGKDLVDTAFVLPKETALTWGEEAARQLLNDPKAQRIIETVRNGKQ
ncbi:MAG: hydroxymethylbilane synthase [Chitinophagaceae bacterium]|nr:MAG: hydroxymethylbilane synthase [Chitinophagaceae bacterium]